MKAKMREFASSLAGRGSGSGCGYCVANPGLCRPPLCPLLLRPGGPIAVIHGRRVDAVFVFPAQTLSGPLSALIVGAATPAPSSSSATTGGFSWSCVHSPLKLVAHCCNTLQNLKSPVEARRSAQLHPSHKFDCAVAGSDWTHDGTNPNS